MGREGPQDASFLHTPEASPSSSVTVLPTKSREFTARKEELLRSRKAKLAQVLDHHDDLVREAFHLEKFRSLVHYDPHVAKMDKSSVFEQFRASYDLLRTTPLNHTNQSSARRTRGALSGQLDLLVTPSSSSKRPQSRHHLHPGSSAGPAPTTALVLPNSPNLLSVRSSRHDIQGGVSAPRKRGPLTPPRKQQSRFPPKTPGSTHEKERNLPRTPRTPKIHTPSPIQRRTRSNHALVQSHDDVLGTPSLAGTKNKADDPPPESPSRVKRIKLVHRPRLEYSNPRQFPPRPSFDGSLTAFLNSFLYFSDDDAPNTLDQINQLETQAAEEGLKRNNIERLRRMDRFSIFEQKIDVTPPSEPKRRPGHMDTLVTHAIRVSKCIKDEGRARVTGARRISRMVEKHFEHIAGAESREQKAEDKRKAVLVKATLKVVVNEWRLAVAVVAARKKETAKADQIRRGKQHLDVILQQSSQALEAQHSDLAATLRAQRSRSRSSRSNSRAESISETSSERSSSPEPVQDSRASSPQQDVDQTDTNNLPHKESSSTKPSENDAYPYQSAFMQRIRAEFGELQYPDSDDETGSGLTGDEDDDESQIEADITVEGDLNDEDDLAVLFGGRETGLQGSSVVDSIRSSPMYQARLVPGRDHVLFDTAADQSEDYSRHQSPLEESPKSISRPTSDTRSTRGTNSLLSVKAVSQVQRQLEGLGGPGDQDFQLSDVEEDIRRQEEDRAMDAAMEAEDATTDSDSEIDGLAKDAEVPIEELLRRYAMEVDASAPSIPIEARLNGRSRPEEAQTSRIDVDEDDDFPLDVDDVQKLQEADHQLDIEMEEEEGEEQSDDSEVDGLAQDADLPLEELLGRYGYATEERLHTNSVSTQAPARREPGISGSLRGPLSTLHSRPASPPKADNGLIGPDDLSVEGDEDGIHGQSISPSIVRSSEDEFESGNDEGPEELPIPPPFLLRGILRPYQQAGLEWLASLYNNETNGILADEMGLGKTIQTIALLGWLACSKGIWGPHLVIVPTSVLLNWEVEFKRFLPGFKTLPYYGTQKERKERRVGWNNPYAFNVCITSYQIAIADQQVFRRKKWVYMILDEAHNIKNFKSKRWETLLCFNSQRRLLLTGTPLQNNLMELWSLLYFLMPDNGETQSFVRREDFKDLFQNPMERALEDGHTFHDETKQTVHKLHTLLRPYLLRRLKSEVEKQLPKKYEHVVYCRLSKRQRFLYDEFMSRAATKETLASGNFLSIANCLMQLRKVCNHPDLFEVRPILTSFAMSESAVADYEIKELFIRKRLLEADPISQLDLGFLGLEFNTGQEIPLLAARSTRRLEAFRRHADPIAGVVGPPPPLDTRTIAGFRAYRAWQERDAIVSRKRHLAYVNRMRCKHVPVYGSELLRVVRSMASSVLPWAVVKDYRRGYLERVDATSKMVLSYEDRAEACSDVIEQFACITPRVVARGIPKLVVQNHHSSFLPPPENTSFDSLFHRSAVKLQIAFPEPFLLQYDCGKLQELDRLLRERHSGGHRVLIFTQMTKVLDILEIFLNFHGYRYLRLDGSTKIEQRQIITERFNLDSKIFAFIASSRSGGVGINLTGADTVIFYDSDYNPSMDRQCEDRAHRIGQMREVHIFRFISKYTIEESMLRKANQKRSLDEVVIQKGGFDWTKVLVDDFQMEQALAQVEDREDVEAARMAAAEIDLDSTEFNEKAVGGGKEGPVDYVPTADEKAEGTGDGTGSVADYMLRVVERDWDYFGYRRPYIKASRIR